MYQSCTRTLIARLQLLMLIQDRVSLEEIRSDTRNYKMSAEDVSEIKSKSGNSRLRQERERRGWTQSDVAERVRTTRINVGRWENGQTFPSPYYRQKLAELFGKSLQELDLIPEGAEERSEEKLSLPESNTPVSPPVWNVPYRRNPFFTGREELLTHLHTVLRSNKTVALTQPQAISGLGGIGKTQIAIEYAYRYRNEYTAIFWVNASTREVLSADFATLAIVLDLPEKHEQDQDTVIRAVKRWLANHAQWLLILDNVDAPEMIVEFLPAHITGDILLTTRLQALGTNAQSIEVEKMGPEESITFLLRRIKVQVPNGLLDRAMEEHQEQAMQIAAAMDGLPLALDQAGAYIEETHCGLSQYHHLYAIRRKELLLRRGRFPIDHPDSVTTTWSLSFQKIEHENPSAADLLRLLTFLDPEAIPEEMITSCAVELGLALIEIANDPFKLNIIIELLLSYSLIRRSSEVKSLSVHRLVQAVLKDGMDRTSQRLWAERAIRAINCAFPDVELYTWEMCQRCLPHVQVCAIHVEEYAIAIPEAGHLFNKSGTYLMARGSYEQAKLMLHKALTVRQQLLETCHLDTAHTLNDLGEVYRKLGKYQTAEHFLQEALAIRQHALGMEHLDVAQTLHNLANLHRTQGAYAQAEPLYSQALSIRKAASGTNSPLIAESYYGLARLYNSLEKYEQAEEFCKKALHIQEQHFGDIHPLVASTLTILAKIYQGQNRLDLAKDINMRALRIRETISGEDHPKVAVIVNNLAAIYHLKGNYQEAASLVARSLSIHEHSLGQDHPYIAYSLNNLADNFFLQGDYVKAELYYKKALVVREKNLGTSHPHTASIYYNLAKLYSTLERYKEAEEFSAKAEAIRQQVFGPNHPTVAISQEQHTFLRKKLNKENE